MTASAWGKRSRFFGAAALICLAMPLSACDSQVSAQQLACKPCPACSGAVQLSQLDPQSRDRLKNELCDELREESRAQWSREFESEYRAKIENDLRTKIENELRETAQRETAKAVPVPAEPNYPTARPAALPPTQKIEKDSGGLKITRHIFTTKVEHRQPISDRESFSISDASVFCFVEISSPESRDRTVTIRFTHSTGLSQSYTLPISQSPSWRTWAKLNLTRSMTGTWLCEVFNEDNVLLASRPFVVVD